MLIVTDDEHRLRAVDWEDHEDRMRRLLRRRYGENAVALRGDAARLARRGARSKLISRAISTRLHKTPVAANGTRFQSEVWAALRAIPAGATLSYGALATRIGRPKAVRAVGLANGANPIAIFVPCHRVIGADSSLTGYGGGLDRKRWLLAHEGGGVPLLQKFNRRSRDERRRQQARGRWRHGRPSPAAIPLRSRRCSPRTPNGSRRRAMPRRWR